jgi:hypothetical protein
MTFTIIIFMIAIAFYFFGAGIAYSRAIRIISAIKPKYVIPRIIIASSISWIFIAMLKLENRYLNVQ